LSFSEPALCQPSPHGPPTRANCDPKADRRPWLDGRFGPLFRGIPCPFLRFTLLVLHLCLFPKSYLFLVYELCDRRPDNLPRQHSEFPPLFCAGSPCTTRRFPFPRSRTSVYNGVFSARRHQVLLTSPLPFCAVSRNSLFLWKHPFDPRPHHFSTRSAFLGFLESLHPFDPDLVSAVPFPGRHNPSVEEPVPDLSASPIFSETLFFPELLFFLAKGRFKRLTF